MKSSQPQTTPRPWGSSRIGPRRVQGEGFHSLLRVTILLLWQVELLKQEVKEKEADFLAQETQLLEELEASRVTEQQLRASLWAQETKAAQLQLRLRSTESRLEALVAEQQPGHQAQVQLASLYSVLQQALGSACESRLELNGGGDSAPSLWGPEPGEEPPRSSGLWAKPGLAPRVEERGAVLQAVLHQGQGHSLWDGFSQSVNPSSAIC